MSGGHTTILPSQAAPLVTQVLEMPSDPDPSQVYVGEAFTAGGGRLSCVPFGSHLHQQIGLVAIPSGLTQTQQHVCAGSGVPRPIIRAAGLAGAVCNLQAECAQRWA